MRAHSLCIDFAEGYHCRSLIKRWDNDPIEDKRGLLHLRSTHCKSQLLLILVLWIVLLLLMLLLLSHSIVVLLHDHGRNLH